MPTKLTIPGWETQDKRLYYSDQPPIPFKSVFVLNGHLIVEYKDDNYVTSVEIPTSLVQLLLNQTKVEEKQNEEESRSNI